MIRYFPSDKFNNPLFSILIPSWNNLPYLKLCIESIRKNSAFEHQIIVHLNEGNDGSLDFLQEEGLDYTISEENVGVCLALNAASSLAKAEYIAFFNDDMYACPDWDRFLKTEIDEIGETPFFLSATMIEPTETGNACVISPLSFGDLSNKFREEDLLKNYKNEIKGDWSGAAWPPNVLPRSLWNLVGGYSVEFSPGMSSDPDFAMKLWKAGVRYFKGLGDSRVYHFQAKSTGRVQRNDGNTTFLNKWGITQSTFYRYYLRMGKDWSGPLKDPEPGAGLSGARIKSRIKRIWS